MSIVSCSTTSTTAYKVTADTTGKLDFQTGATPTTYMTLDASGNLGIGTSSPSARLESSVSSTSTPSLRLRYNSTSYYFDASMDGNGNTIFMVPAANGVTSGNFVFGAGGAERARIDSSGNLLVGTTSAALTTAGVKLISYSATQANISLGDAGTTNSDVRYTLYSTGAGAYRFYVGMGGTVFATSTTISSLSDARYKENVRDLNVGLAEVMALKPRLYDWKEGKGADIKNARGFIAQEFEEVFPDLIDEWRDPAPEGEEPYKSVRADLIPVLVKAIQEQQAIIDTLTNRITALEGAA